MPRNQDSELSGFYVYSTNILVWLPPLVFSGLVQNGISQSFGVFVVAMFAVVAILIICCFPAWKNMLSVFHKEEEETMFDEQEDATPAVPFDESSVEVAA